MRKLFAVILIVFFTVQFFSCAGSSKTARGTGIGTATGAVIGGVIGKQAGNTLMGAIIGAAVGGAAGAYIGHYMDKQAEEIQQDLAGAEVTRVGEGIKITFKSGLLFDVDKADLRAEAQKNLTDFSATLNKYSDTIVLIEGHTDDTGSDEYNLELSKKRAQAVATYLTAQKVDPNRFTINGYGESQPAVANDTAEGRQANRRVELAIMANDKLKKAAQDQAK